MEEKVLQIAQELFNNENITNESKIGDFEQWDSLGQINFFMAIESELSVSCSPDEVIESDSIKKIVELLNSKK